MSGRKQLEFFLLRYMPDAVKGEFVNIGVVLSGEGYAEVRLTRDWRRVRCLDGDADVETLAAMEEAIRAELRKAPEDVQLFLEESFSNTLQFTAPAACLAEDPAQEIERLAALYLESASRDRARQASGRQVIVGAMREAFERHGVWRLMNHNIAVAKYTHAGDPLKLDCGYRPNGLIRLFHAVSLATDVNAAKVLAFSYPQIAEGITRLDKASAQLTAIVEPELDHDDEQVGFALATFERSRIAVATTADIDALAHKARVEMKV